jgi:putative transposase
LFPADAVTQGKSKTIILAPIEAKVPVAIELVEVIGITLTHGTGLRKTKVPANVQSATSEELERSQSFGWSDYMNRNLGSAHINEAQDNSLRLGRFACAHPDTSGQQIIQILKEGDAGVPLNEVWRKYSISSATYDKWKAKYGGLEASGVQRLKALETGNTKLKRMYAELSLVLCKRWRMPWQKKL